MKSSIVLFDLDGTLTPPRGAIDDETAQSVLDLLRNTEARVGIVTGSDLPYVVQQLGVWSSVLRDAGLEIFSCNGTKHYKSSGDDWMLYDTAPEMREVLGAESWRSLITTLHSAQLRLIREYPDLPLTGNFISYRGPTMNWCPIGRDAKEPDRAIFEKMDSESKIRVRSMDWLVDCFELSMPGKVQVTLGGNTSFDIFVKGWDKTYVLTRLRGMDCWFVGDRCREGGNDHTIYEALYKRNRAFETMGPMHTRTIISEITTRIGTKC